MAYFRPPEIKALKKADTENMLHPFSSIQNVNEKGPKIIYWANKARVYDVEGKEYIDGFAGLWYNNIGHGREEIIETVKEQMGTLDVFHTFAEFSNVPAIQLAQRINEMVPIDNGKVFFAGSGSEANDSLFKIARYYWSARGMDGKDCIISRSKGYHGVSYGPITATQFPNYHKGFGPLPPSFAAIEAPYCYYCPWGKEYPHCGLLCAEALEEKINELNPDKVAAFIAEPVIGAGGIIVPPAGYYEKIREICDRCEVLFIADEVITGFGRTGKDFGIEHWQGVIPDALTLAKGITSGYVPLGAAVISDKIFQGLKLKDNFFHGFTYSGHPLACRVALKNIEILEAENLKQNAEAMGKRLLEGLKSINSDYIGEIRGLGLMTAVELVKDRNTKEKFKRPINQRIFEAAYNSGVICRPLEKDLIALSPPLIIPEEDIDTIVEVLGRAISRAADT